MQNAKSYGPYAVTSYQVVLGVCWAVNSMPFLASIMWMPGKEEGGMQLLFLFGLLIMVFLYRLIPLLVVIYSLMPLIDPILGRWVHLPLFFSRINISFIFENWIFAATAIFGYVWHQIDLHHAVPGTHP